LAAKTSYKTVQVSNIPVERREEGYFSLSLWTTDLNASTEFVERLHLLCPVQDICEADLKPVDSKVKVTDLTHLTDVDLEKIIIQSDVVEIPGNFGWRDTKISRCVMRLAKRHGKLCILGISSNREKTTILNARHAGVIRRLRAFVKAWDIRLTQRYMVRRCDGARVVGQGLRPLVEQHAKSIHVDIASWISSKDFHVQRQEEAIPARVAMAARLEPMKGTHIGVEAVAGVVAGGTQVALQIIGEGPEKGVLKQLVDQLELSDMTQFLGQLAYPEAFFEALRTSDFVLLTNLNDEQPRLIFDAISRGAIPICPRTDTYRGLGLDDKLLYEQGSASDLRETLSRMISLDHCARNDLRMALVELAGQYTIESMHAKRFAWVLSLLQGLDKGVPE
jgi:glycosyltransferase involved in cell wall biosynthesis